jgi:hypothetical protein
MTKCIKNRDILVAQASTFQFRRNSIFKFFKMDNFNNVQNGKHGYSFPKKRAKFHVAR